MDRGTTGLKENFTCNSGVSLLQEGDSWYTPKGGLLGNWARRTLSKVGSVSSTQTGVRYDLEAKWMRPRLGLKDFKSQVRRDNTVGRVHVCGQSGFDPYHQIWSPKPAQPEVIPERRFNSNPSALPVWPPNRRSKSHRPTTPICLGKAKTQTVTNPLVEKGKEEEIRECLTVGLQLRELPAGTAEPRVQGQGGSTPAAPSRTACLDAPPRPTPAPHPQC